MFGVKSCKPNTGAPLSETCSPKSYILYDSKSQRKTLDLRDVNPKDATVFPRNIYKGQTFATQKYLWEPPRDKEMMVVKYSETDKLPDHFVRFSYNSENFQPGSYARGFQVSRDCLGEPQPAGMAPNRFYSPGYYQHNRSAKMM